MLKIGDEVILNKEYMEKKFRIYGKSSEFLTWYNLHKNETFRIINMENIFDSTWYILNKRTSSEFEENELIPTLPIKINKLIEEIKNETPNNTN